MLTIHLVVIGDRMPAWVEDGVGQYRKRIRGRMALQVIEIAAVRRGKNADLNKIQSEEDKRLLAAVPAGCRIIALDREGAAMSTVQMADKFDCWLQDGTQAALMVGGPEGLSPGLISRADEKWSLSALTIAHPVVRVVIAEQVYRCHSILEGLPYHR